MTEMMKPRRYKAGDRVTLKDGVTETIEKDCPEHEKYSGSPSYWLKNGNWVQESYIRGFGPRKYQAGDRVVYKSPVTGVEEVVTIEKDCPEYEYRLDSGGCTVAYWLKGSPEYEYERGTVAYHLKGSTWTTEQTLVRLAPAWKFKKDDLVRLACSVGGIAAGVVRKVVKVNTNPDGSVYYVLDGEHGDAGFYEHQLVAPGFIRKGDLLRHKGNGEIIASVVDYNEESMSYELVSEAKQMDDLIAKKDKMEEERDAARADALAQVKVSDDLRRKYLLVRSERDELRKVIDVDDLVAKKDKMEEERDAARADAFAQVKVADDLRRKYTDVANERDELRKVIDKKNQEIATLKKWNEAFVCAAPVCASVSDNSKLALDNSKLALDNTLLKAKVVELEKKDQETDKGLFVVAILFLAVGLVFGAATVRYFHEEPEEVVVPAGALRIPLHR